MENLSEQDLNRREPVGTADKRWTVLFIFLVSMVTFLDRVNISIAGVPIAREYGLNHIQLGAIFSAFAIGYTILQMPAGWLGDHFGQKRVLVLALVWWSVFTALTARAGEGFLAGLVGIVPAFCVVRFLLGIGEAATLPCSNGIITNWFTPDERGWPAGVMLAGVGVGSAVTPPLVSWIMVHWGWGSAFDICAAIGILLALCFHFRVSERPSSDIGNANHPRLTARSVDTSRIAGERVPQGSPDLREAPWRQIFRVPALWLLTLGIALFGYVAYLYYFWFYLYLVNIRGIPAVRSSFFTTLPFLAMAVGAPLGGWLGDHWIPRLGRMRARRNVAIAGLLSASVLLCCGAEIQDPFIAIGCLSLAAGSAYIANSSYWATAPDICPSFSAMVTGTMNTGANLGGAVSAILTPWVAARLGWVAALALAAVASVVAAILWIFTKVPRTEYATPSN